MLIDILFGIGRSHLEVPPSALCSCLGGRHVCRGELPGGRGRFSQGKANKHIESNQGEV